MDNHNICDKKLNILDLLLLFAVAMIIFFDSSLALRFGFQDKVMTVVYPPLFLYILARITFTKFSPGVNGKFYIFVVILGLICWDIKDYFLDQDFFKICLQFFFVPFMLAYSLENSLRPRFQKYLRFIVVSLLIFEILVAIYERVTLNLLFGDEEVFNVMHAGQSWGFRSGALFGHPLANAFIVTIMMIFMLASDMKITYKLVLWSLCMVSFLCFNERGNILMGLASSVALLYCIRSTLSKMQKKLFYFLCFLIVVLFTYTLLTTELGGRLFNLDTSLTDDSDARLMAFSAFDFLSDRDILWGNSTLYDFLLVVMDVSGIENGFIAILIKYGLVFGIPIIILFTWIEIRLLNVYPRLIFWIIFGTFNVIAFTNPHIAGYRPWIFFFVSYYAFVPIKYVEGYKIKRDLIKEEYNTLKNLPTRHTASSQM